MSRYPAMFSRLADADAGAFVPFVMVGDPTPAASEAIIEALIAGGADALELGTPFSDPVADGPTIQRAHLRALEAGAGLADCLEVVARVRARHPQLPIGMLIYGNVPFAVGLEEFYARCAAAGVDSVLLPDVPVRESAEFSAAAAAAGIDAVYIAPPSATAQTLDAVARASRGYVYAVSRAGVTGTERASSTVGLAQSVARLRQDAAAPVMLGFGISGPEQVAEAIAAGADGAISGSAVVKLVEAHTPALAAAARTAGEDSPEYAAAVAALQAELRDFVATMKAATHRDRHQ
ncbi:MULTISPECIES: tryptophan synthase subunit alpha [unclassified Actinomyces]|uniref:tryptophan synthase subunit alpha n=1 Tax=unclassified Actinomyces TaxID=2609248 RepID=UPI0013A6AF80|nr:MULTISPECIES: tryptophan synthase subunit alpha [unclassified Actinomyces]MBW3070111.1 tryptophan synthase subunit alpha [Actinomyces sp. 594]NDR52520.1 tryptophan synthase subunit alpha [Actinomyces sp. 565]